VYSYQHIGNLRQYLFADTLKRALRWRGYDVHHVINITDVGHLVDDADQGDDKMEAASRREHRTVEQITGHYTSVFWDDLAAINVLSPNEWPKATAYVPKMIDFARVLEDNGSAYVLPEGLYFDTATQPGYGALAGIDLSAQQATGRVELVEGKRAASDFALWRTFTDGVTRLLQWESPWGVGAPGWHLECSVMSMSLLGAHFDIHTGGVDHRELHHVNEIAQSEAYLGDGQPWVRYWVHGEFLTLKDRKMAKSAGDILRLADLVEKGVHPLAFRFLVLQSHYRSQIEFAEPSAAAAAVGFKRLALRMRDAVGGADPTADTTADTTVDTTTPITFDEAMAGASAALQERLEALDAAIADDLQTPSILAQLQTWSKDELPESDWAVLLRAVNSLTGLDLGALTAADFTPPLPPTIDKAWVEERVAERDAARNAKDWVAADTLRDELAAAGIRVEDTPDGPHWYAVYQ
jgi:cysteinyl-tRNA synthetase